MFRKYALGKWSILNKISGYSAPQTSVDGNIKKPLVCWVLLAIISLLYGCATVVNEYNLPDQNLDTSPDVGKTRVVFYNALNPLFLDGSWRIGIKIDDVGVENLHINKYVQLFLSPGQYKLSLSHVDVVKFSNDYQLQVGRETMFIKVYNGIVSTKYQIQDAEPENFKSKYKPVVPQTIN